jgi:hypothetical protein
VQIAKPRHWTTIAWPPMPLGTILSNNTLTQLHAELAGKIDSNRKSGDKLRMQMMQVEAVIKMLRPDFPINRIAPKRRNTGNPWFKRGTLYRALLTCSGGLRSP